MFIKRNLTNYIKAMLDKFPVVSLTGPRQSGKTTLLKSEFPDFKYFNLERFDVKEMVLSDPIGFLNHAGEKVIFDEAQNLPELFNYIQVKSDERNTTGQYILSGSQSFLLNENISQSLAGRVSITHLFPFDASEIDLKKMSIPEILFSGFYPRIFSEKILPVDYYPSYLQTYIERDLRTLKTIGNLNTFTRFLGLCAGRVGQVLNISSLANDTGISVNTAKAWLSLLESSFIIFLLQPYYRNFNKRLIKSPKIYFYDSGVLGSLLRVTNPDMVKSHFAYGALFENLIISEIIKIKNHLGKRPAVYYWRESNGAEIDCIIEKDSRNIFALEIKGGETFNSDYFKNLRKLPDEHKGTKIIKKVIYAGSRKSEISGIEIMPWKRTVPFIINNL